MLRALFALSGLAFLTACADPISIEVTNETGGPLLLRMWHYDDYNDTEFDTWGSVPTEGGLVEFGNFPQLNKSWDFNMDAYGLYSFSGKAVSGERGGFTDVTFGAEDINGFGVVVVNESGIDVEELYFKRTDDGGGQIDLGERPGDAHGPLLAGEDATYALPHHGDHGWSCVWYDAAGNQNIVYNDFNTAVAGEDTTLTLY